MLSKKQILIANKNSFLVFLLSTNTIGRPSIVIITLTSKKSEWPEVSMTKRSSTHKRARTFMPITPSMYLQHLIWSYWRPAGFMNRGAAAPSWGWDGSIITSRGVTPTDLSPYGAASSPIGW